MIQGWSSAGLIKKQVPHLVGFDPHSYLQWGWRCRHFGMWEVFLEVYCSPPPHLIFAHDHSTPLSSSTFNSTVHEKRGGETVTTACSSLRFTEALYTPASMNTCIFICFSLWLTSFFQTGTCNPPTCSVCKLHPEVTGRGTLLKMGIHLYAVTHVAS